LQGYIKIESVNNGVVCYNLVMKKFSILFSLILIFSLTILIGSRVLNSPEKTSYPLKEVYIVPVDIEEAEKAQAVKFLEDILKEKFPNVITIVDDPLADPLEAYDGERRQYDVKIILQLLERKYSDPEIHVIAITNEDIFSKGLNFVYSSLNKNENIGILSTRQLLYIIVDGKVTGFADALLKKERVEKLVLRMVGLMGGLKPRFSGDEQCIMRFSNNLEELDMKGTEWCGNEEKLILEFQEL